MINYELNASKPLIILDEGERWEGEEANIVYWSEIDIPDSCLSIPALVDVHGSELKHKYIRLIQDLGNREILGKSVKEHLEITEYLSFWWLTLVAEKSPWKSKDIYTVFKALVLESIVSEFEGTELIVITNDQRLLKWLKAKVKDTDKNILVIDNFRKRSKISGWKSWLPHSLQSVLFIARLLVQCRSVLFVNKKFSNYIEDNAPVKTVVTYSDSLNLGAFKKGEVISGYWSGLDQHFISSGASINWLMMYVPSNDFPTFKGALVARNLAFNDDNVQQVSFLEEFLSVKLTLKIMFRYIKLRLKSSKLTSILSNEADVLFFLNDDWERSIKGVAAIDGCVKLSLFEEAFDALPVNVASGKGLYVYENQAWERALISVWKKKSNQELIGFQHVSGKFYDLRPFDTYQSEMGNTDYSEYVMPDKVVVTGTAAKEEMEESQFPSDRLYIAESLRSLYLNNCQATSNKLQINNNGLTLLVITDYLPSITDHQLKMISESWPEINRIFEKVIIKPHPNCPVDSILDKYEISSKSSLKVESCALSNLWSTADVVFASNATGASLESAYMQLPTIVSMNNNYFNMSPLRGVKGVSFAATARELELSLRNLTISNLADDYLCLDLSLNQWKTLLES